jgi:hypothetical protein
MAVVPSTLDNVLALPDILDAQRFLLIVGDIPGSAFDETLSFKVSAFSIPGTSNEAFDVNLGGGQLNFRGRRLYATTISLTMFEDSQGNTLRPLREWMERVAGSQSNNSQGYIDTYSVTAQLSQFDTTGREVARYLIHRFYPQDIPETSLSAESSQALQINCSFRMTYFTSSQVEQQL